MSSLTETAQYCIYLSKKVCEPSIVKFAVSIISSIGIGIGSVLFSNVYFDAVVAILSLIIIDAITAIYRAYVTGYEVESRKLFRTALKIVMYFLIISAGNFADTALIGQSRFIEGALIGFLGITEVISIIENFGKSGYPMPAKLLNIIKSKK